MEYKRYYDKRSGRLTAGKKEWTQHDMNSQHADMKKITEKNQAKQTETGYRVQKKGDIKWRNYFSIPALVEISS